jgi:hypothetical protein
MNESSHNVGPWNIVEGKITGQLESAWQDFDNETEGAYNDASHRHCFVAGWNARHELTCVHEWELGDCTKMHDRFFWFCTQCKAVDETPDVNPPQAGVLS